MENGISVLFSFILEVWKVDHFSYSSKGKANIHRFSLLGVLVGLKRETHSYFSVEGRKQAI